MLASNTPSGVAPKPASPSTASLPTTTSGSASDRTPPTALASTSVAVTNDDVASPATTGLLSGVAPASTPEDVGLSRPRGADDDSAVDDATVILMCDDPAPASKSATRVNTPTAARDDAVTVAPPPQQQQQQQPRGFFSRLGLDRVIATLFPGPKRDPERFLGKPVNPFHYDEALHSTPLQVLKMIVVGLVLFLPRLLVLLLALILMTSSAALRVFVSGGVKRDPVTGGAFPLAGQLIFNVGRFGARLFLLAFGYWWITFEDRRSEEDKKRFAPILAANHCSFIDPFLMAWLEGPMVASKAELTELPVIGTLCKGLQVIPISREDTSNRKQVSCEIKRRTRWQYDQPKEVLKRHGAFPPLLIFPEATCTNTKSVIQFKLGAFAPRVPVQPIALDFRQRYLDASWVGAPSVALTALRLMCQVYNRLTVTYLPIDEIRSDTDTPYDFAQRVRGSIAEALDVPTSEHNFLDVLLEREVEALKLPIDTVNVEMGAVSDAVVVVASSAAAPRQPGARIDERETLEATRRNLRAFAAFNRSRDGALNEDEFAALLGFRPSGPERLANAGLIGAAFRHWDHDGDGRINFREFLLLSGAVRVSRLAQLHEEQLRSRRNSAVGSAPMTPAETAEARQRSLLHVGGVPQHSNTAVARELAVADGQNENSNNEDDDADDVVCDDLRRAFALCFGAFDDDGDGVASLDDITAAIVNAAPGVAPGDIRSLFGYAATIGTVAKTPHDPDDTGNVENTPFGGDGPMAEDATDDDDDDGDTVTFEQYMMLCERHPLLAASLLDQVAVAEAASAASSSSSDLSAAGGSTAPFA